MTVAKLHHMYEIPAYERKYTAEIEQQTCGWWEASVSCEGKSLGRCGYAPFRWITVLLAKNCARRHRKHKLPTRIDL